MQTDKRIGHHNRRGHCRQGALGVVEKGCAAYDDVFGRCQDLLAWDDPMSRDSLMSSKHSKKRGVWSEMGSNRQMRQNSNEIASVWCERNDSIHGGVDGGWAVFQPVA